MLFYTLHSLIEQLLNNGKRLYCSFVDAKKAFDSTYRNALWLKIYKLGINVKMLRIIRALYVSVKCCIRHCDSYSESRKENPQKLTQVSSRSHPRHLVGKRTAQKDTIIEITSDSQVNSNFPYRWSPASLTTTVELQWLEH